MLVLTTDVLPPAHLRLKRSKMSQSAKMQSSEIVALGLSLPLKRA